MSVALGATNGLSMKANKGTGDLRLVATRARMFTRASRATNITSKCLALLMLG